MANKVVRIDGYDFERNDKFLFDANIWLYLFAPPGSANNFATEKYSQAFKLMLSVKCQLFINSVILSEYINRYCRIEWSGRYKNKFPNFKDFRSSADFGNIGNNAANSMKEILKFSGRVDDAFSVCAIEEIIDLSGSGAMDFNDGLILDSCKRNGLTLVTHDADFTQGEINIITANNKLVVACK